MVFGKQPLTESAIMKEIPAATGPRKVGKILRQVKKFSPSTVANVTNALERQVNGPCFPKAAREAAIGRIRETRINGTRMRF